MTFEELKKEIRKIAKCSGKAYPIVNVYEDRQCQAPARAGESYYWTTPSGKTRITHPNAYKWAKVYHKSTRSVEVGFLWLQAAKEFRPGTPWQMITDRALEMEGGR